MNIMNYHLYANGAQMPQIMAEDAGAAELRNPVFYIRTQYKTGTVRRILQSMRAGKYALHQTAANTCGCCMHPGISCEQA